MLLLSIKARLLGPQLPWQQWCVDSLLESLGDRSVLSATQLVANQLKLWVESSSSDVTGFQCRGDLPYIDAGDLLPQQPSSQVRGAWAVSDVQSPFSLDRPWAAFAGHPQAQTMCPLCLSLECGTSALEGTLWHWCWESSGRGTKFTPQWQEMQRGDSAEQEAEAGSGQGTC